MRVTPGPRGRLPTALLNEQHHDEDDQERQSVRPRGGERDELQRRVHRDDKMEGRLRCHAASLTRRITSIDIANANRVTLPDNEPRR